MSPMGYPHSVGPVKMPNALSGMRFLICNGSRKRRGGRYRGEGQPGGTAALDADGHRMAEIIYTDTGRKAGGKRCCDRRPACTGSGAPVAESESGGNTGRITQAVFGVRSEKTKKQPQAEALEEGRPPTEVRSHTRAPGKKKATHEELYGALPVLEVKIPLTGEERRCAYCNAPMQTVGYTEVREELRITPAKVERVKYLQETAVCPECRKDGDGTFVKAAVPTALMPHSPASASAAAHIMFQKVFMGTPYYRQEMAMFRQGLTLPRETMANWFIYCSRNYFLPLYERMHECLVQRDMLHADETTCQVLHETGRDAETTLWMWICLTGNDGKEAIILYDYQQGRGGRHPQEFLKGFHGPLQCDGYQGYNKVEDVILVCCPAHCRRKFYEALPKEWQKKIKLLDILSEEAIPEPVLPEEEEILQWIPAEVGLAYCNRLFFPERKLKGLSPEERKQKRVRSSTVW